MPYMRIPFCCAVSLVICALCLEVPASATVILPADFDTVVTDSRVIVHGRVVEVRAELTGPRREIESVVTVAVIESFKGAAATSVAFRSPTGQVGRYRRVLVGAPEFAEGDEVVLFLQGRPPAMPTVFGLSQGVYRVRRTAAARAIVMPSPPMEAAGRIVRGDPARVPIPIESFAREIRAVLERAR